MLKLSGKTHRCCENPSVKLYDCVSLRPHKQTGERSLQNIISDGHSRDSLPWSRSVCCLECQEWVLQHPSELPSIQTLLHTFPSEGQMLPELSPWKGLSIMGAHRHQDCNWLLTPGKADEEDIASLGCGTNLQLLSPGGCAQDREPACRLAGAEEIQGDLR